MSKWSLRRTLIIGINLAVIAVLMITTWNIYRDILHEIDEVFDAQMAQTAKSIASLYPVDALAESNPQEIPLSSFYDLGEVDDGSLERGQSGHKYEHKIGFFVTTEQGQPLAYTQQALDFDFTDRRAGYHDAKHSGYTWYVYSYYSAAKSIWVHTFQREDVRSELSGYLARDQLYPLLLMWVPISLIVLFIVYFALRPIHQFAQDLRSREVNQLHPITTELPQELEPIRAAVNILLARVDLFSKREKRFIADASHELRTPLSAIKVHAENVQHADDPMHAKQSAAAIIESVDRMSNLVNQLLSLNRLDSSAALTNSASLQVKEIVMTAINGLPSHDVERFEWDIKVPELAVQGNELLLVSAISNLIANAMKFSPSESTISIRGQQKASHILLSITDQGTGVPKEVLQHLGNRFYRHQEHSHIEGAGLGLSIVAKVIELHQGTVTFKQAKSGGLLVEIQLPKVED
ncbi:histidine kinase [Pseudidiomarina aestuarii]|uniref:histidine kinase n=1 Tax=Pseudidiomarina aestuarii TaxID=624146 RepID=A0A2T4D3Z4_9GAMM|nr:histidine kinase [Pseudidiomarina aestuarii]PTB87271.1 histidine kinase [Pseudidiomarina aestuarii]PTB88531.1 histidine kinase [Pseudidiomarina aestuarii]PTB90285.1 histidine kinase [Pseudidiomarina aestuarii]